MLDLKKKKNNWGKSLPYTYYMLSLPLGNKDEQDRNRKKIPGFVNHTIL